MPDGWVRSFVVVLRRDGARRAALRVADRMLRLHRFRLLGRALDGPFAPLPLPPGAEFRELDRPALLRLRAGRRDLPADFYRDELDPHERCFAIVIEGELVYVDWISARGSSGFFRLAHDELEGSRVHCMPAFRGRALHLAAQSRLIPLLAAERWRTLYYAVHERNPAGIRPLERAGFADVGTGYRLGPVTWTVRRGARREGDAALAG